jgi:integrase
MIREEVTPHTLRYTYIASLFAAGADQEYVADQSGTRGRDHDEPHLSLRAAASPPR